MNLMNGKMNVTSIYWMKMKEPTKMKADSVSMAHHTYSLYNELRLKIKQSLTCSRITSPLIKIVIP